VGVAWGQYERDPSLWYLHRLQAQGLRVPLDRPASAAERADLANDGLMIRYLDWGLIGRPLCTTFAVTPEQEKATGQRLFTWVHLRYRLAPQGIVMRFEAKDEPLNLPALRKRNQRYWDRMVIPDLHGVRTDQDLDPNYVVNHYATMRVHLGELYERTGDPSRAAMIYQEVIQRRPGEPPAEEALKGLRRLAGGRL